jgi:hypothetical protein
MREQIPVRRVDGGVVVEFAFPVLDGLLVVLLADTRILSIETTWR